MRLACSGYFKNKKATDETINEDGWMRTGDVCVRDPSGNYTIMDRTKELIKYKGMAVPEVALKACCAERHLTPFLVS